MILSASTAVGPRCFALVKRALQRIKPFLEAAADVEIADGGQDRNGSAAVLPLDLMLDTRTVDAAKLAGNLA